jgi:hypothetical protein
MITAQRSAAPPNHRTRQPGRDVASIYFVMSPGNLMVTSYKGMIVREESQRMRVGRDAILVAGGATRHVIDMTELLGTDIPARDEAEIYRTGAINYVARFPTLPTALIAPTPHTYGLARIFEIVARLNLKEPVIRVVRSWDDAAAFLGVDLTEARARRDAEHAQHANS